MHKHFSVRVVAGLAIFVATLLGVSFGEADETPAWNFSSQIYINKVADVLESDIPTTFFGGGNIDCTTIHITNCSIDTPYGSVYDSSIWIDGKWRPIADYGNNRANFFAIPNSDTAITASNSPVFGSYLYLTDTISTSLTPKYILGLPDANLGVENKVLDHLQLDHPPDRMLIDKTAASLDADLNSMGFSGDSHWMIVTDPDIATLRVNLNTGEVLPFGRVFTYGNGLNPKPKNAISSDGRYAVVASQDASTFTIYALSSCDTVPDSISKPVSCQSRELINSGLITSHIPGYTGIRYIRFLDDDTLSFYASYFDGVATKYAQFTLSTRPEPANKQQYLALGDSYISGEGAFRYESGTDTPENLCHVSLLSYPFQLGQDLGYDSYHSVACSGAKTSDIIDQTISYLGQSHSKIKRSVYSQGQVDTILNDFSPGYLDQLDFVTHYRPKVITVSIGGNNVGFSGKLRHCINIDECYSTYEDRLEFVQEVNNNFPDLANTYTKIKNAGAADAKVYVIGYPQIANADGDCAVNVHMNHDELVFAQQAISYLDDVISKAATKAGVFYVDTQDALYGHRLCEAGPGSIAMNGLVAGNDAFINGVGPFGNESYHPNAYGHQLLEAKILKVTQNLTAAMPAADLSAQPPAEAGQEILNAPHSGRAVKITEFDSGISADLAYQQTPIDISINGPEHLLPSNSSVQAEIHSIPVSLGNFTTDSSANLSTQIIIPADIHAGFHTLHFYGTDVANQAIDIYKTIYVAATADDLDGNGVLDSIQKCIGVAPSGQDFDQDGIDDACDGEITQPSAPTIKSEVSGSVSAQGDGLVLAATPPSDSHTNSGSTRPTNIAFTTRTNSTPAVLGIRTALPSAKPASNRSDNLRVSNQYFAETGLVIFLVSGLVYSAKRWIV